MEPGPERDAALRRAIISSLAGLEGDQLLKCVRALANVPADRPTDRAAVKLLTDDDARDWIDEDTLTPREFQVVAGISHGRSSRVIGETYGLSEHTVNTYIKHILTKLGARDRGHAACIALRKGLIP